MHNKGTPHNKEDITMTSTTSKFPGSTNLEVVVRVGEVYRVPENIASASLDAVKIHAIVVPEAEDVMQGINIAVLPVEFIERVLDKETYIVYKVMDDEGVWSPVEHTLNRDMFIRTYLISRPL